MAVAVLAVAGGAAAQSITGSIEIKKKLTKRSVTASVPVYQRGTAVKLGADADADPLALERSRVVLYLEGPGLTGGPAHAGPIQVQQLDRRFSPDVLVVATGTTVSFPNMDPIFHDVFSLSKAKSFDLGSYDQGETRSVTFTKPGIVDVYCHLHPNMAATIVVTPNRWYAQAERSGRYRIADVPPGQYTLVAWHKAAGFFRKTVVVEAGQDASADFFIPLEDDAHGAAPVKDAAMVMPGDK